MRPAADCGLELPFLPMPLGETEPPGVPLGLDAPAHGRIEREITFALMLNTRHGVLGGARMPGPAMVRALNAAFALLDRMPADTHPAQRRFVTAKICFLAGSSLILSGAQGDDVRPFAGHIARHVALADLAAAPEPDPSPLTLSARNNHLALRALALIVAAQVCDVPAHFIQGQALLDRYLSGMDARGLFEAEAVRGASALWYCNLAVMLLCAAAWIGRCSGLVLVPPDRLEQAVSGLAGVIADPARIHRLARRNMYPNPLHGADPARLDRGFLSGFHRGRHYLSWVPLYRALCPSADLGEIFAPVGDSFPWGCEFIGGFADVLLHPHAAFSKQDNFQKGI